MENSPGLRLVRGGLHGGYGGTVFVGGGRFPVYGMELVGSGAHRAKA
jgi:hypothetical protein